MFERILLPFQEQGYSLMRIFLGLLFAAHGAQKLFGLFGGQKAPLVSLMGLAGIIEFFGGLAIALGVLTSFVAFFTAGEMVVAYCMVHLPRGWWPIENNGELAVLYFFGFLVIATKGSGSFSLDRVLWKRAPEPPV